MLDELNQCGSGQNDLGLISMRRFRADLGVVPSTPWRWIQRGWLDQPIDIGGRKYLTAEMIRRFKERAARGEFAGKTKPPRPKNSPDPEQVVRGNGGGRGLNPRAAGVIPMDWAEKILKQKGTSNWEMPKISKKNLPDACSLSAQQIKRLDWVRCNAPSKSAAFIRAYSGKSPAAAIKAQCLDCAGCDVSVIRECPSTACPLWRYRPYKGEKSESTV